MLRFQANLFVRISAILGQLKRVTENDKSFLSREDREKISSTFESLIVGLRAIELESAPAQGNRIKEAVNSENEITTQQLGIMLAELQNRIEDELSVALCLLLPREKAREYYEKINLFGDKAFNNFPSANFDIEEAGKCFAVARYTACVMHLQRVLEVGLKAYGTFLGIASLATSTQPNWNRILDETRKEIKERNDRAIITKIWTLPEQKEFCEDVQPFLETVKTAWRNPSMHADKTYSEEIAEDIFSTVKRFMKHLAEHLDESGTFTS